MGKNSGRVRAGRWRQLRADCMACHTQDLALNPLSSWSWALAASTCPWVVRLRILPPRTDPQHPCSFTLHFCCSPTGTLSGLSLRGVTQGSPTIRCPSRHYPHPCLSFSAKLLEVAAVTRHPGLLSSQAWLSSWVMPPSPTLQS